MKRKFEWCCCLLLLCTVAAMGKPTTIYYVSPKGKDTNTGSLAAPLHTIGKALQKAVAGDTILVRAGRYPEKPLLEKSGQPGAYIVLKAFPGEKPVIDGTGLPVAGFEGLLTLRNVSWVVVEGFEVCHFKSAGKEGRPDGIQVSGAGSHIILRHNRIYDIANNVPPAEGRSAHAIHVMGNAPAPLSDILIEYNEIKDCKTGYSENLTINGYVDGFIIRNNKILNGENIGIDAAGGYTMNADSSKNYARNGLIAGNEIGNINFVNGPIRSSGDYGAIAIYIDGARNMIVDGNKIYNSDRGIGLASENDRYPTRDCIVRNNFVYNCFLSGIYLGGYLNAATGGTYNCYVVNNTLFRNNRVKGAFGEVEGELRLTENCYDNTISNNLVYAGAANDVFLHKYTATGARNVLSNNLYFGNAAHTWIWNGQPYHTLAAWQSACAGDSNSLWGIDPLLKQTDSLHPDLHLRAGSPAEKAGHYFSAAIHGNTDIDGYPRARNHQVNIGAQATPLPRLGNETAAQKEQRMKWWINDRFGLFIHWGLYAVPAKQEWLKRDERMTNEAYQPYFDQFNPDKFNPAEWARMAKAAGMKYAVLTVKHHEGFCLFDSKYTDYKAPNTPAGRDLVREWVNAFRAEGLKVGFYYSLLDWHHPDFTIDELHPLQPRGSGDTAYARLNKGKDIGKYRTYIYHQLSELLSNYGKIDILWLDFSYGGIGGKGREQWGSVDIWNMARKLQPGILLNDRMDLEAYDDGDDFVTEEQKETLQWPELNGRKMPWEACQTITGFWGYHRDEANYKSADQLITNLIKTVSKGGNLLLNVGPTARGTIDSGSINRLHAVGDWLRFNGNAVYGCSQAPEEWQAPEGCLLTYNAAAKKLYLHLLTYPEKPLLLKGYKGKLNYALFLADHSAIQLTDNKEEDILLHLPAKNPFTGITVVELTLL